MAEPTVPHSTAYMGPQRDLFWNSDHLELLGRRLDLGEVRSVLDVGCGQGHWGRALDRLTAPGAETIGIDREAEWIAEATRQAEVAGSAGRFRYLQASAEALPFDDRRFDCTTCQTVLIHVPDPVAVLREMMRVTKPGGIVLAAEPNNRAGLLVEVAPGDDYSSELPLARLAFYLTCARGKVALGEGDDSVGDRLPGLFARVGLETIEVRLADKAWPLIPPYATDEQRTIRALFSTEASEGTWLGWSESHARRLFVAGGGSKGDFSAEWAARRREVTALAGALEHETLHTAGGSIHYLIAGRRPA